MKLPDSMRYVEAVTPGGPEVMRVAAGPLPRPEADEVLIRVRASGVNRPDVLQRKGLYPPPPNASPILGLEVAGEVVAAGEKVSEWKAGARDARSEGRGLRSYTCNDAAADNHRVHHEAPYHG